jgi:hypothetical protein
LGAGAVHFLEICLILMINAGLVFFMQRFQNRTLDRKIKILKNEVQELEDLVAAIIEEFEDVAGSLEPVEQTARVIEASPITEPAQNVRAESPKTSVFETGSPESKHQRILDLSRQGLPVEEIAKELGIGQGEVSLILGLYQRS